MIWFICFSIVLTQLLIAILLKLAVLLRVDEPIKNDKEPNRFSVIIPFHNEETRIKELIVSLNNSVVIEGFEFIFVDDHSTDLTAQIIKWELKVPYQIIKNTGDKGKKNAIKVGIENAKHKNILTWDADISFGANYLNELEKLNLHDMDILPVRMMSNTLIGKLACIEFTFLESLGRGLGSLEHPTIANGANLIFKKDLFQAYDKQREDYGIPSGDDLFLLNIFQKNNRFIYQHNNSHLAVSTEAPSSFNALIQQRKRWISKMAKLMSTSSVFGLAILVLVQMAFITALIMSFIEPIFLSAIAVKILAEIIFTEQYLKRHWSHLPILLLHQIWYPFYCLALILPHKKEERWT